jgi:hypothetical protein
VAWAGWLPRSLCHSSMYSRVLPAGMCSALRVRHVRVSTWSPTHKRSSPVSREMMLMMGADRWQRCRDLCAYERVDVAGHGDRDGACCFSPAFWHRSSAANVVLVIASAGAVLFRRVCTPWRHVCRGLRNRPNSRAQRAVDSPFAMPRSRSTSVVGR